MSDNHIARRRALDLQQDVSAAPLGGYVVVTNIDRLSPAPPLLGDAPGDEPCTFERRGFFDFDDPIPGAKPS